MLIMLPAALDARFEIIEPLKAAGGEADLFIVRDKQQGERAVLKLYRHGIEPRTEVLERVSRAAPDQLVRLIEYGRDEGVPYELLEYCEHGSLRSLLKGRPMPADAARTLLGELADALEHLHGFDIVHRDLKPENVLLRGLLPLDLVLTDFGTSSLAQATMHYTSVARTLRYGAPEAGSNWVGKATDYWALGMMMVEALTGRHPFEGLSEAVIAHWLVTRPIDVSGIADARWQQLCRGLLTRDPKHRWGADEIKRWIAGDATLAVVEEQAAPRLGESSPYRVGDTDCRTPRELAVALAAHWSIGIKDLKRGMLRAWLQNELRDQNLARFAGDMEEAPGMSDDERLVRLLMRLDPAMPPVYRGFDVSVSGLAALTRKALDDDAEAREIVMGLVEQRLLGVYPGDALPGAQDAFNQAKEEFERVLKQAVAAGAPKDVVPRGPEWQLRMLLFVLEPPNDLLANLRASAMRVGGGAAQRCDWYRALGDRDSASAAVLAAMILFGPSAAQEGIRVVKDQALRRLLALGTTIRASAPLMQALGAELDTLTADAESMLDEDAAMALPARIDTFALALDREIGELWTQEVFDGRVIEDPSRHAQLRARINEWASWRAGDAWARFGDQIEIAQAVERRAYKVQLDSQIESRRVPYKYSAPDIARMPPHARATLDDVWSCAMPALPEFGSGIRLPAPREVQCGRCGVRGRAELLESWGTTLYPFSTTFACQDKVGVQCQTRVAWANEVLPVPKTPSVVGDFVTSQTTEEEPEDCRIELLAPGIEPKWIALMPQAAVKKECEEKIATVATDLRNGERITWQRLRLAWAGLTEVHYRYRGKSYVVWIPDRVESLPIALDHPLPSESTAAEQRAPQPAANPAPPAATDTPSITAEPMPAATTRPALDRHAQGAASGWAKSVSLWGVAITVVLLVIYWLLFRQR
jgi:serine/threonine protein kinase